MVNDTAYKFVKSIPIEDYLSDRGFEHSKRLNAHNNAYFCKYHSDSGKPNLIASKTKNICNCFVCEFGGDVINCESLLRYRRKSKDLDKKDFEELVNSMYEEFSGMSLNLYSEEIYKGYLQKEKAYQEGVFLKCLNEYESGKLIGMEKPDLEYTLSRGLSYETIMLYGLVGRKVENRNYIAMPLVWEKAVVGLKYRRNDTLYNEGLRYYIPTGSDTGYPHLMPVGDIRKEKVMFFTEDSFSALALRTMGFPAASLFSSNTIKNGYENIFHDIFTGKHLIIMPDKGDAGDMLISEFEKIDIDFTVSRTPDIEGLKDFSDYVKINKQEAYNFAIKEWKRVNEYLRIS